MTARRLRLAAALALALGAAGPALATQAITFRNAGPEFPIRLPDAWTVSLIDNGIAVDDKAGDLHFRIEGLLPRDVDKAMEAYAALFAKQGVVRAGDARKLEETVNGTPVIDLQVPATRNGQPMTIKFMVVGLKPGVDRVVLLGFWSTPEVSRAHAADMMQVVRDIVRP